MAATRTKKSDSSANGAEPRRLVIVESPAKARKIASYLGRNFVVESSKGHIRDLPRKAAEVPAKYKGQPWANLAVNVDDGFEPIYIVTPDKRSTVTELKEALKSVDELYLATDGDREGEAIAWHLLETLKPKIPVRRMVFYEITESAIRDAAANPRELDRDLVEAQETRRILDRLYGYQVSEVLWDKVKYGLSAGRVQSVATRIVVQRERERMKFVPASYWDIAATMDAGEDASPRTFGSRLISVDGTRLATGRDFGSDGRVKASSDVRVLDETEARRLAEALDGVDMRVASVEEKPYTRRPYAPFMTSTLQQEAGRKLRFSSNTTMSLAQRLYENGYITYMRTDSTTLSDSAIAAARAQAETLYGKEYVHPTPRQYNRKVKNAQEAHEAIRPAGETFRTPGQVANELSSDEYRLYELIWQRTIASQMADVRGTTMTVRIAGTAGSGEECVFSSSGRTITFPGFLKAYVETVDSEQGGEADDAERPLPVLVKDQPLTVAELAADGHTTNPPPRYTEASLVKALEELGIGRPSTYAPTISTIQDRGYVWKKGAALVPAWIAFVVIGLLEEHFGRLVDYDFTATLEDELDGIAAGREERTNWLSGFYFGGAVGPEGSVGRSGGLKKLIEVSANIDKDLAKSIQLFEDAAGHKIVAKVGKFGAWIEREVPGVDPKQRDKANLPDTLPPDELNLELAEQMFATPVDEGRVLGTDPVTGHEIMAKNGRYGPFVTEVLPEEAQNGSSKAKKPKPRTGSLFKTMSVDTVTLEEALRLLSLPRVVGKDPQSGDEITAQNGRYGPYLRKGTDSRSLSTEDQIFTVTLDEALKIYSEPKKRGRAAAASAPPLKELGNDPVSGKPMVVKDGRFGPYVTDGEYNASLRKSDSVEELTDERAAQLLAEKREKGPAPKKTPARKPAAAKTAATKTAAKSTTKTTAKTGTKTATKPRTTASRAKTK